MISTAIKTLELRSAWTIARNSSTHKHNVFLTLERDGVVGYGEAAPNVRYGEDAQTTRAAIDQVGPLIDSADLFQYTRVKALVEQEIPGHKAAQAAVDMAVLDWVGKSLGAPLHRIWGLDALAGPVTSYSIGIDRPETIRQKVLEAREYPVLKIKLGGGNDEEIIEAVRSVTDKPIRVDANEGWRDRQEALGKIECLSRLGVEFVEQPMPAAMVAEARWLRERSPLPLVADEAALTAGSIAGLAGAYDGINIKLMKAGGLQEALAMIHVARAVGLKVMLGCMIESSLAISAAAQLAPSADWADLDGNLLIGNDPFVGVGVEGGRLVLSDRPGLGAGPR